MIFFSILANIKVSSIQLCLASIETNGIVLAITKGLYLEVHRKRREGVPALNPDQNLSCQVNMSPLVYVI